MASNLNNICQNILNDVPDSLGCGLVDLSSGMLLGVYHNVPYFTQAYLDAVAAAAVDMFRGKNVRRIEDLISKQRGKPMKDTFQEVFMSTPHTYHFMKLIPEKGVLLVLITRKSTNQGMGWAGVRGAVDDVTDALPTLNA